MSRGFAVFPHIPLNDLRSAFRFVNIGTTVARPEYEFGQLYMHMPSGVSCNATHNISTHIRFSCDASTMVWLFSSARSPCRRSYKLNTLIPIQLGAPEYLNRHGCVHNFDWRTSLACISTKVCTVVDPITRYTYDLTSLAGRQYNATRGSATYHFGICNEAGAPCAVGAGVGMCMSNATATTTTVAGDSSQPISRPLGGFNTYLRYNQTGAPFLQYTGGAVCGAIGRTWSARVEFVCASAGMSEGAVVVEENEDCVVIVHFVTKLVCQQQIGCVATDLRSGMEYDLSPLMATKRNYVATVKGEAVDGVGRDKVVRIVFVCFSFEICNRISLSGTVLPQRLPAAGAAVSAQLSGRFGSLYGHQFVVESDPGKGEHSESS